jgi:hypothetical protein
MSNEYDGDIFGEEPQVDPDDFDNDVFVDGGTRDDVRIFLLIVSIMKFNFANYSWTNL